ncbi:unnamed protein product, partial [Symbiodinium pilosum]
RDVAAARQVKSKEDSVWLSVCRSNLSDASQATDFWITAVTETGVVTLKDGVAAQSSVPPSQFADGAWKAIWREFRVLVSGGLQPNEVSLSASSIGKAREQMSAASLSTCNASI